MDHFRYAVNLLCLASVQTSTMHDLLAVTSVHCLQSRSWLLLFIVVFIRSGMIIHSVFPSFTLLTVCVLAANESNETLSETSLKRCAQVNKKLRPRFYLVRRCARSDVRIVNLAYFNSVGRCVEFAMFKSGLAFNFGWLKGGVGHCEVLECPEYDTLGFLRRRDNFDYYSLYANPLPSMDWVCLPKVGMFRIGRGEARTASLRKCQEWALMQTPRNKTEGEKGASSSTPGDHTGMATSVSTARPDEHFTQELQPSNFPSSPSLPIPTVPPPGVPPDVPPLPFAPPFEPSPFEPPFLPPNAFPGNPEDPALWNPEYRLGDLLNTTNVTDTKRMEAGQLANILSQDRTNNLTIFLKSKIGKFFPPVLVGMSTVPDDESLFATSDGEPLPCFRFRAWAPGHPLPTKHLKAFLKRRSSTAKPGATPVRTNLTVSANATATNTSQTTKNETSNNGSKINITTSAAERKRDEMTLCVYIQRDSLWHTNLCSTKTMFLCEFLPSGGPCRDVNSTDERAECEFEKIGTTEDRCSAWNGKMITTMMPIEPEKDDGDKNDGGGDKDDDNTNGEDTDEDNGSADEDNNTDQEDNNGINEQDNNHTDEQDNNGAAEQDKNNSGDEQTNNNADEYDNYDEDGEVPEKEIDNNGDNKSNYDYDYGINNNQENNNKPITDYDDSVVSDDN